MGHGNGRSDATAAAEDRTFSDRPAATLKTNSDKQTVSEKERRMRKLHCDIYQARLKDDGFLEPSSRAKSATVAQGIEN
jgi:hypothetical protein